MTLSAKFNFEFQQDHTMYLGCLMEDSEAHLVTGDGSNRAICGNLRA